MTHPEELLAGYVDGTLSEGERAVVDAHLPTCAVCSEEVALSAPAARTLAALPEVPVPFGVTGRVLAEAGRAFERQQTARWGRLQWAAGLAAAAALVAVVALNLPGFGGADQEELATGGAAAATPVPAEMAQEPLASLRLERQPDADYDAGAVADLAETTAESLAADRQVEAGAAPAGDFASPDVAIDCLRASGGPFAPTDTLVRVIEARFDGTSAYLGVFFQGPGADQPPDHVVIWVVAADDCRILSTASKRL